MFYDDDDTINYLWVPAFIYQSVNMQFEFSDRLEFFFFHINNKLLYYKYVNKYVIELLSALLTINRVPNIFKDREVRIKIIISYYSNLEKKHIFSYEFYCFRTVSDLTIS